MEYLVTWKIDIDGDTPLDAARIAKEIQLDIASEATNFEVQNKETGEVTMIDDV